MNPLRKARLMASSGLLVLLLAAGTAWAQSRNLAPGFEALPAGAKAVLMPVDVELFSLSAGGVVEPKADWTADAQRHMNDALRQVLNRSQLEVVALDEKDGDEFAEQVGLHAAVARSINLHHSLGGALTLPSKGGRLDWSFDNAMQPLQRKTGARYGLFVWVRDSYASTERKIAIAAMALFGVVGGGGVQTGYASLVDLETGQVLWFNRLLRGSGDLREAGAAAESMNALMAGFPAAR